MADVTDKEFADKTKDGVVVVDFWAAWCAPCHALSSILEEVEKEAEGVTVLKLNVDENQKTAQEHRVTAIPTVKIFKDGEVVKEMIGLHPKEKYLEEIEATKE